MTSQESLAMPANPPSPESHPEPGPELTTGLTRRSMGSGVWKALKRLARKPALWMMVILVSAVSGITVAAIGGKQLYEVTAVVTANSTGQVPVQVETWREIAPLELQKQWSNHSAEIASSLGSSKQEWDQVVTIFPTIYPNVVIKAHGPKRETYEAALSLFLKKLKESHPAVQKQLALKKKKAELEESIQAEKTKKSNLLKTAGINDVFFEVAKQREALTSIEYRKRMALADKQSVTAEIASIKQKLEEQKKILGNQIETESRTSYEQVAQILQLRQKILKDLIDEEKYLINLRAELEQKNTKRENLEKAIKEGKIEKTELGGVLQEIQTIQQKMAGSPKLKELQNEWLNLNKSIQPPAPSPRSQPAYALIQSLQSKSLDKQVERESLEHTLTFLDKEIGAIQNLLSRLISVQKQIEESNETIQSLQNEMEALSKTETAPPVSDGQFFQFEPVTQKKPSYVAYTNRTWLFQSVFLPCLGLGMFLLFVTEWVRGARSAKDVGDALQIPVLFLPPTRTDSSDYRELCRLGRVSTQQSPLALQIQPADPRDPTMASAARVAEGLAHAFCQRGEKVLMVDLNATGDTMEGLMDFLTSNRESWEPLAKPGSHPQILRMAPGRQTPFSEMLQGERMKVFLESVGASRSVVLFLGSGLTQVKQVESLSAHSGSIVVTSGNPVLGHESLDALLDLTSQGKRPLALVLA